MGTHVITRKIELKVLGDADTRKESWSKINTYNNKLYRVANNLITYLYCNDNLKEMLFNSNHTPRDINKLEKKEIKDLRKKYSDQVEELFNNAAQSSRGYRFTVNQEPEMPSNMLSGLNKEVVESYKKFLKEGFFGERTIPTFRKGLPMPTIKRNLKIQKDYTFRWYDKIHFELFFGRDRSNNKEIIDRCLTGEYQICDSSVQLKDSKIFLLLSCKIPKKELYLDSETVVGVDLGVSMAVYCALNKGLKRLSISNQILKPRLKIQAQRRSKFQAMKMAPGGKGRKAKMKYDKLAGAERNTVRTLNHQISKQVVDFALKNNAYKINMEDLKGFSKEEKDSFILRNWSYFELQTMIEQKANRYGIQVEKVSPTYTSQVCNSCGCKGERKEQKEFICYNKDCNVNKVNADFNAAKNIANGGVGLTYNQEVRSLFGLLDYGQVVLPEVEEERQKLIHSTSTFHFLKEKYGIANCITESCEK